MADDDGLPIHARENRAYWDRTAEDWVEAGERDRLAVDEQRLSASQQQQQRLHDDDDSLV